MYIDPNMPVTSVACPKGEGSGCWTTPPLRHACNISGVSIGGGGALYIELLYEVYVLFVKNYTAEMTQITM